MERGVKALAYETIETADGLLPCLKPMSEIAGRLSVQEAAKYLEMPQGGMGVLLGGVTGVEPATVVVIGGGVVGINAAKMACGLGAKVYILDMNLERLAYLDDVMPANCFPVMSNAAVLRELVLKADVVIGAVLVAGAKAPKLLTKEMLKEMKKGSVIVDVAIDQGGCFETSKATTHDNPCYEVDGVIHYCVANMPGAVAKTSTLALTNATLPYAVEIANKGWKKAMQENKEIKRGANVIKGKVTYKAVAQAFRNVVNAQEERMTEIHEAESYKNRILAEANATASRLVSEARGFRQRRIAHAEGEADRFSLLAAQYEKDPLTLARRVYLDAMIAVLPYIRTYVISGDEEGEDVIDLRFFSRK